MSLEPRLPPELEMRIFELAAEALSHPRRILPLLQVARRTLIWSDQSWLVIFKRHLMKIKDRALALQSGFLGRSLCSETD
jgi:hypothetical protein